MATEELCPGNNCIRICVSVAAAAILTVVYLAVAGGVYVLTTPDAVAAIAPGSSIPSVSELTLPFQVDADEASRSGPLPQE